MKPSFAWDKIQKDDKGKIVLLYRHQRIFDEGMVKPGMKVLDVGGWGMLAQRLTQEGADCTILDLFTQDQAYPDRVRSLPHKVGDVRDPDCFPDRTFDLVTCFEMLEHCGDIPAALANIRSWLKPRCWLVGTIPLPGRIHINDPTVTILSQEELVAALKKAGFATVSAEPTGSIRASDPPCCTYFKALRR